MEINYFLLTQCIVTLNGKKLISINPVYSAVRNYNVSYFVKWLANPGLGPQSFWLDVDGIFRNMLSYKEKKKTIKSVFNISLNGKKFTYC